MRSDLVFCALRKAENRYSLCRVCARGTREIHVRTGRIEDTINEVLVILAKPMSPLLGASEDSSSPHVGSRLLLNNHKHHYASGRVSAQRRDRDDKSLFAIDQHSRPCTGAGLDLL